jgi:GDPmannose 4,6-dehydratase
MIRNYRESYGMHASNGLLFNHEGERRGETFVTRKITMALAAMKKGTQKVLTLGNMDSLRDWGYAKDYVEGMWRMLQQDEPGDYVLATNETHTIRQFVEEAVKYCGWEIEWESAGTDEKGYDKESGKLLVEINPKYFRPAEVDLLLGDYTKAKEVLGWEPATKFKDLVKLMMEHDLKNV